MPRILQRRERMPRLARLLMFVAALAALAATGCVRVQAHQRERLAAPGMRAPVWPEQASSDEHVFVVREGSQGATAAGGGGCGCN